MNGTKQSHAPADNGKPAQTLGVGYDALKAGRGVLVLFGRGIDAGGLAELRETLMLRRNLLEVLQVTRDAGSGEGFAFRHLHRFV